MDTAVVLVSGGVNSCVLTGVAAKEYVLALMHVSFGQRTQDREFACFEGICKHYSPGKKIAVSMPHFQAIGGSSRVDRKVPVEDAKALGRGCASTYVPGLIPTLLGMAFHWASAIGAKHVLIGSSDGGGVEGIQTSDLFPDHRRSVYHLYNQLMEIVAKNGSKVQLATPLIDMGRGEVVRLGQHLSVPFESSWSCDRDGERPCGTCYGCVSRAQGFLEAAAPDPIMIRKG